MYNAFYNPTEEEMKHIRPALLKLAGFAAIEKVNKEQRNRTLATMQDNYTATTVQRIGV